jgi:hypothetical protein
MSRPEDIESILARLMPAAMSERAESEIGETIDQMARDAGLDISAIRPTRPRWPWVAGIAASAVFAAVVISRPDPNTTPAANAVPSPEAVEAAELVRISHTDTLQSIVEEGWRDDVGGKPHQAVRLHMLAEQRILDEETGIVMTVSQPREEVLLVPVHTF